MRVFYEWNWDFTTVCKWGKQGRSENWEVEGSKNQLFDQKGAATWDATANTTVVATVDLKSDFENRPSSNQQQV